MTPATIQLIRLGLDETPSVAPVPFDEEGLSWILDSGLGPLLWHALERRPGLRICGTASEISEFTQTCTKKQALPGLFDFRNRRILSNGC